MAYVLGEQYKQRVDHALRVVEGMPLQGGVFTIPTRFETLQQPGEKQFRICTFTGSWSINATKTVTFRGVTSTPNTVAAVNIVCGLNPGTVTCDVSIAKDGTAWYLV